MEKKCFIERKKLSGAITARSKNIGKSFKPLSLLVSVEER